MRKLHVSGFHCKSVTVSGICNGAMNPLMVSSGMPFLHNTQFDAIFPDLSWRALAGIAVTIHTGCSDSYRLAGV